MSIENRDPLSPAERESYREQMGTMKLPDEVNRQGAGPPKTTNKDGSLDEVRGGFRSSDQDAKNIDE